MARSASSLLLLSHAHEKFINFIVFLPPKEQLLISLLFLYCIFILNFIDLLFYLGHFLLPTSFGFNLLSIFRFLEV